MPRRNSNPIHYNTNVNVKLTPCVEETDQIESNEQSPDSYQKTRPSGKTSPSSYDSGMLTGSNNTSGPGSVVQRKRNQNSNSISNNTNENSDDSTSLELNNMNVVGKDPTGRIQDFLNSSSQNHEVPLVNQASLGKKHSGRMRRHSQNYNAQLSHSVLDSGLENMMISPGCGSGRRANKNSFSNDRKSRSGKSINICKSGAGGKFTWGKPGIEYSHGCPSGAYDINDPNYDEFGEDENTVYEVKTYGGANKNLLDADIKKMLEGPFREYLVNSDDSELLSMFVSEPMQYNEVNAGRVYFHLLTLGLEGSKKFRGHLWKLIEKCSVLTYNQNIETNGILQQLESSDFQLAHSNALLKALEDFFDARVELIIDNPDYDEFISKILGCLISKCGNSTKDSKLDNFLKEECELRAKTFSKVVNVSYSIAKRIVKDQGVCRRTHSKDSESSSGSKGIDDGDDNLGLVTCFDNIMSTIWITNDFLTPEQLSYELQKIVDDWKYDGYSSKSLIEDIQKGLNTPHYYHELVYKLISKAMYVGTPESVNACIETLEACVKKEIIESNQVKQGFLRIFEDFDELTIDIPRCAVMISKVVNLAMDKKIIDDEVRVRMPRARGDRRRAFSEMAQ